MTNIEERFAGNGDNGSLNKSQLLCRAGVEKESRRRPTENRVANVTPLRFGRGATGEESCATFRESGRIAAIKRLGRFPE
jgi:hypothetical protein